jgi:hypothetical protein
MPVATKRRWAMVVGAAALVAVAIMSRYAWLPDVIWKQERVVVRTTTNDGHELTVTQQWGKDFYWTLLYDARPDGGQRVYVVDPDDTKHWDGVISLDEGRKKATVKLRGEVNGVYEWRNGEYRNAVGNVIEPLRVK